MVQAFGLKFLENDMIKIGIFGGTFDPFTCSHYEIVKKVLNDKLVDKVIVMPSIVKYYRSEKDCLFSNDDKRTILNKWFDSVDDINRVILDFHEYDLVEEYADGTSYLKSRRYIDMLYYVMNHYGKKYPDSKVEYYTIIGEDSYKNFTKWYNWSEILQKSKLIVFGRLNKLIANGVSRDYQEMVPTAYHRYLNEKFNSVSATVIRNRLVKEMSGMSMGPGATCLSLYLEEIEEYKRSGKTHIELQEELEHAACYVNRDKEKLNNTKCSLNSLKQENNEEKLLDKDQSFKHSDLEYESLRDKALDMARTLKLIEKEAHQCAMCDGREDCGYSADDFIKKVCYLLFQSQGYHKEEL